MAQEVWASSRPCRPRHRVSEGRIDLAWEFFERAIPASYDSREEYNLPIYKTKRIMKETINNWLTNLDYWAEIEQLNLNII